MHSKGNKGTKAFSKTAAACILTMGLVGSPYTMAIADPGENEGQSISQSEKSIRVRRRPIPCLRLTLP